MGDYISSQFYSAALNIPQPVGIYKLIFHILKGYRKLQKAFSIALSSINYPYIKQTQTVGFESQTQFLPFTVSRASYDEYFKNAWHRRSFASKKVHHVILYDSE